MSVEDHTVSFSLEVNVEPALIATRKYMTVLYRTMALTDRLGLTTTAEIRERIALLNQVRLAYNAVKAARMAAGDPLAWAVAVLSVAEVGVEIGSQFIREDSGSEGPQ
jgi:hypothetical protein